MIKGANLALRVLPELCALGALGYWGFKTGGGTLAKIGLGVGAPLGAAVAWGAFVSPRAPVQLPGPMSLVLQVLVFGAAAAGLAAAGHRTLALGFGVIVVLDAVLMYVWGQCWGITIERKSQQVVSPGMDAGSSVGRRRIPFCRTMHRCWCFRVAGGFDVPVFGH